MSHYNAIGEIAEAPTAAGASRWMTALAPYSPAIGHTDRGHTELIITLPATDLAQATTTALAVLLRAAPALTTLHVLPTTEYDRRTEDVAIPDLVGAAEAGAIMGVTRQRVQQLAEAGQIPARKVGRGLVLPRSTVEAIANLRKPS